MPAKVSATPTHCHGRGALAQEIVASATVTIG